MSFLDDMYEGPCEHFIYYLGSKYQQYYTPNKNYAPRVVYPVGIIPRQTEEGYDVHLLESRVGSSFFYVKAIGGVDYKGEKIPDVEIAFGSSSHLAATVAIAMAEGMITIK